MAHLGGASVVIEADQVTTPLEFRSPLSSADLDAIRWLLEDCPDAPVGPQRRLYHDMRAATGRIGEALWRALTPTDSAKEALEALTSAGGIDEVRFVSDDPEFLALPWELLSPPDTDTVPLLQTRPLTRTLSTRNPVEASRATRTDGPLRILLVSPRPYGDRDVRARTVRGPVLKAVAQSGGAVRVDFLRPATATRLAEVLASHEAYDIVHFDGHGFSDATAAGPSSGVLFEREDGGPDPVSGAEFAKIFSASRPTLVVLNACRSARLPGSDDGVGSVATALLRHGLPAVLAMTHNVSAAVVTRFTTDFYAALSAGESLAAATALARQGLVAPADATFSRPFQVLPVLYTATDLERSPMRSHPQPTDLPANGQPDDLDLLMYRDDELNRLERLLGAPDHLPVVVSGVIGSGKSRFLRTFARYATLTGAFDHVVFHPTGDGEKDPTGRVLHVWDEIEDRRRYAPVESAAARLPSHHRMIIATRYDQFEGPHHHHALGDIGTETTGLLLADHVMRHETPVSSPTILWLPRASGWHAASLRAILRALEGAPALDVCWQMEVGFSDGGDDDALVLPEVRRCLARLAEPAFALVGLFGHMVVPLLPALVTDRGVPLTDDCRRALDRTIPEEEWLRMFVSAERLGLVEPVLPGHPRLGYTVPPGVSYALRAELRG
ncbi:hypothetical protein Ais01nite_55200 [Asanoa ishikariensis]|nr:hypothetical protein Ais01nite_55200 [Asanoa ishikariensis]